MSKIQRYSGVQTYAGCQQKYKFQYVDNLEGDTSIDLEFGTALHAGIEAHFKLGDPIATFNNYMADIDPNLPKARFTQDQLTEMGSIFIKRFVRLHAKKYDLKYIEKQMQFDVLGHAFQGTIDAVGLYENVPSVIDFKTASYAYSDRKILSNHQLLLYTHAARTTLNYPVEQVVYVVFVKSATAPRIQVQKRPITQIDIDKALAEVKIICDDINEKAKTGLYLKNKNECERCPFFERCHK